MNINKKDSILCIDNTLGLLEYLGYNNYIFSNITVVLSLSNEDYFNNITLWKKYI